MYGNTRTLICCLSTLWLSGCGPALQQPTPAESEIDRIAEQLQTEPATKLPEAVSDALLGTGSINAPAVAEERFDLSVTDAPAKTFFISLMDGTGSNIVVHPELAGNITLELKNVSVTDVLEVTREIYGYDYKFNNGIYTIYPRELQTQIFHIDYLDVKRVGLSDTSVTVGQLRSSGNDRNNRNNNSNNYNQNTDSGLLDLLIDQNTDNNNRSRNNRSAGSSQGARIQTLNHTDFWSSLQATIGALIGGTDGGRQVMVTPQAGMVIVKALPNELHNVRDFLERSELSVQRQVLLEAKIIEVQLNDNYNAGINWNEITGALDYSYSDSRSRTNLTGNVTESLSGTFNSVIGINEINDFIDLLGKQGSVQILSSPRQSTVNNQKAVLRVGTDEYFVTGISSDTTTSASAVINTPDIEITSFFSGIALDVTPQISKDGDVIMHVHPVITEVQDLVKPVQLGDQTFRFPTAFRDIRESDSIVRAKSGEVVVLGGLMQEVEEVEKRRYAGPGDIPIIGNAFRGKTAKVRKSELVILIKPTIIDRDATRDQVQQSRQRIKQLGDEQRRLLKIN